MCSINAVFCSVSASTVFKSGTAGELSAEDTERVKSRKPGQFYVKLNDEVFDNDTITALQWLCRGLPCVCAPKMGRPNRIKSSSVKCNLHSWVLTCLCRNINMASIVSHLKHNTIVQYCSKPYFSHQSLYLTTFSRSLCTLLVS